MEYRDSNAPMDGLPDTHENDPALKRLTVTHNLQGAPENRI
jgi:hypothetical protein